MVSAKRILSSFRPIVQSKPRLHPNNSSPAIVNSPNFYIFSPINEKPNVGFYRILSLNYRYEHFQVSSTSADYQSISEAMYLLYYNFDHIYQFVYSSLHSPSWRCLNIYYSYCFYVKQKVPLLLLYNKRIGLTNSVLPEEV